MKKYLLIPTAVLMVFSFTKCSSPKSSTASSTKSEGNKAIVEGLKSEYTDEQIASGKLTWQEKCQKCHKLYSPDSHSIAQWENILPSMSQKAKLDDQQAALVRAYILTHTTQ